MQMGMAGFILKNTVSENGTVTRGVCVVDENGMLEQIHETTGISIQADGVHCDSEAVQKWITPDSNVSMNMWAGYPDFIQVLDERFAEFLKDEAGDPLKRISSSKYCRRSFKRRRCGCKGSGNTR